MRSLTDSTSDDESDTHIMHRSGQYITHRSDSDDADSVIDEPETEASISTEGSSRQDINLFTSENDTVVKAILDAKELRRNHPPSVILDNMTMDVCFHPVADIIAVASITGDVFMFKYDNEKTTLTSTIELHLKACRDIEFSEDGRTLFSVGKDLCIAVTDVGTERLIRSYEKAHEQPIYTMTIINEHVFVTGDDDGTVRLWDLRRKENDPVFSIKEVEDYISAMITNRDAKYLVCASGDGYLTTLNIPERKLHVQSEEYDEEFTCLGLFKFERKLLTASSRGKMYMYNWGEFGLHSDEFPRFSIAKMAINCMIPITDNVVITGGEDGIVRAINLFPHRHLGVVGQHNFPVEALDISNDGTLIASSSHDNDIKFWNVQYFETLNVEAVKGGKQKQLTHNLPSSQINNPSDFFAEL